MEFEGFDWDDGNVGKCQKHGLSTAEIESVFSGPMLLLNDDANSKSEIRYRAIGTTAKNRKAFIVFTLRRNLIRPISARYMHEREIQHYEKDDTDL